ncbi:hypothetical protein HK105_200913 [Polyrhizophydium stewartii]|uniref:Enoyl reductase (ER) domain-containing protein n=1 Tax=Polyrhizophydium stewartii TaxID=2732419 RepID=A0ABR4NIC3_9FUNG
MQAVVLQRSETAGKRPYDPVRIARVPRPAAAGADGAARAVVRLHAAALNHRDVFIRERQYPAVVDGSVLGADGAGVLVAAPPGTALAPGARVVINSSVGWDAAAAAPENILDQRILGLLPKPGTFAEYIAVDPALVHPAPEHLSFEELAALPLAGLTAFRATFTLGEVSRGKTVLVPGIGGGVATFALQFAHAVGANVFVTSSSQAKIDGAIALGAAGGAKYTDADWVDQLTAKAGLFDVIIDGASGPNVAAYLRLLKPGGILVIYGATAGSKVTLTVPYLWFKHVQIRGACMGNNEEFGRMLKLISEHKLRPVIASVFDGLNSIDQAFDMMRKGAQFGKIVVRIAGPDAADSAKL